MNTHRIISKDFTFLNKTHLPLSDKQVRLRDTIQKKIDSGIYKLENCRCLCGCDNAIIIAETDRYGFSLKTAICKACGILRTNPRLDQNSLKEFYGKEYQGLYFNAETSGIPAHFKAQCTNGIYIKDFIELHHKDFKFKGRTILEIGCSAGGILAPFLKAGAAVRGYDYNDSYLEYGKSVDKRLDLRHGGLDDIRNIPDRFDLIIMNHVLEHMYDPKEAIQVAGKLLKDEGILYLSVPSIKNAQYYNSPTRSYLGSLHIAHLYYFSRNSLVSIMDNFEPIFIDDKVRGIFRRSPGKKAAPFPDEYDRNISFILWRENSLLGALLRKVDVALHEHHLYARTLWFLHCLRNKGA